MKRVLAAVAVCGVFAAGYLVGSVSPIQVAHAQIGGSAPWPAAAAAPSGPNGATHFYAIDTGTRTLVTCTQSGKKTECSKQPLP